jgi:pyrroloquinoline quinone (PQQ) biosynthesis protein C
MSGIEFHAYHRKYAQRWLQPVHEHPFWARVAGGHATRSQVIGFAFEKYHYIEAAHEHMGLAAAHAAPHLQKHLTRHFIENYRHGDIYRRGLQSLYSDEAILHACPLPTTRALVNFLNEAAIADSFGYYAANEALQMAENMGEGDGNARRVEYFHAALRRHYPFTDKLVDAFVVHTTLDQNLGHDVFAQMCRDVPTLTVCEVQRAMNFTREVTERLVTFMDGIDRWYAAFPELPRRVQPLGAH